MTFNAKIGDFMDLLVISSCDTSLYHSEGGATLLSLCDPDKEFGICIINVAWTPQFLAKLQNRNCYRLSRISWALTQISSFMPHGVNT